MARGDLNTKQRRFVQVFDGNATKAALAAGYSERTARVQGAKLLTNPAIADAIEKRDGEAPARILKIATRAERQAFWSRVLNDDNEDMRNRLKASELLGKSQADFIERIEHGISDDFAALLDSARRRVEVIDAPQDVQQLSDQLDDIARDDDGQ